MSEIRPIEIRTHVLSVDCLIAELRGRFPRSVFRLQCSPGGSGFTKVHAVQIATLPNTQGLSSLKAST